MDNTKKPARPNQKWIPAEKNQTEITGRTPIDIALSYVERGWSPTPVLLKQKKPMLEEWQKLRITAEEAGRYFNENPTNIGVLLGEPSEGLIDIDLDCDDAVWLAGFFLPKTATFGRDQNPKSHWLYICDAIPNTEKFAEDGKTTLLEFRSTGCQSVFPGSTYKNGEPIRWDDLAEMEPARISKEGTEDFLNQVRMLAAATLLSRCWQGGTRDDIATALAGGLIRDGWSAERADSFIEKIASAAGDEEAKSREKAQRLSSILDEQKHGHVPGWKKLSEIIGEARAGKLREWLTVGACQKRTTEQIDIIVAELNRKHAVVMVGGKCLVMTELPPDPVTHRRDIALSHPSDLRNFYANRQIFVGKRRINAAQLWLESPHRREYVSIVFSPGGKVPGYYNLWRGFAVEPHQGNCSLYLNHVLENIADGNEEIYRYVIAWMADAVQHPDERPGISLVLRGGQGTGKGSFASHFGSLFGPHFVQINSPRYLLGNFNAHLKDALIVFADEAFWAGDHTAAGVLKGMVTEHVLMIEYKGKDAISVKNHIRIIAASNHDWVVPAGLDERRFCVLDVGEKRKQDSTYFGAIIEQMDNGGREALLYFLLNYNLSGFDLRRIPQTRALMDNKLKSADQITRWWAEVLEAGTQFEDEKNEWQDEVLRGGLYDEFVRKAKQQGLRYIPNGSDFGKKLKSLCPEMKRSNKRIDGRQTWFYLFPSLEECRKKFAEITGIEIESKELAAIKNNKTPNNNK